MTRQDVPAARAVEERAVDRTRSLINAKAAVSSDERAMVTRTYRFAMSVAPAITSLGVEL
jgi:hypothetical protein